MRARQIITRGTTDRLTEDLGVCEAGDMSFQTEPYETEVVFIDHGSTVVVPGGEDKDKHGGELERQYSGVNRTN